MLFYSCLKCHACTPDRPFLLRVPSSLRPIFGNVGGANKDELFSESQVRAALEAYAQTEQLLRGLDDRPLPPGRMTLDKLLAGSLYNKKEPFQEVWSCRRNAIAQ